jgi:pyruvate, water dikinase
MPVHPVLRRIQRGGIPLLSSVYNDGCVVSEESQDPVEEGTSPTCSGRRVNSGCAPLDLLLDHFRLGDNVVWQVESLDDYRLFANDFFRQSARDQRTFIYIRFGTHPPVLKSGPGMVIESFDPREGFDVFSAQVNRIITHWGRKAFYVFDNLSSLVDLWATDELLANFFQATCPYLFELDTVAYFALDRDRHSVAAVTRIRDTTQVLLDTFRMEQALHVRPLKVWQRHAPQMFLPHRVEQGDWIPVAAEAVPEPLLASETSAPWDVVYADLCVVHAQGGKGFDAGKVNGLRADLCRMLLGTDEKILRLADAYLSLDALMHIRSRVIGSGRIGGKAAGMILARAIVRRACAEAASAFPLLDEDSFHIGSDVFYTFIVHNDLFRTRLAVTRAGAMTHDEFEQLENRFVAGRFDAARVQAFEALLDELGDAPFIVRSSSFLEDGFGNAFAGKYRSEFCVNTGSRAERLDAFLHAVKLVYASTLNPDAISYRRNRGMLESDEQMAILVQRVAGAAHGRYFFPALAGVAFSRNLYAWTERIDPAAGIIRLVFGLGTRAVNRVSRDYPRMVAVSHPELRPEIGDKVSVYSQRYVDVLDLADGDLVTVPLAEVLKEGPFPNLHLLVSLWQDGYLTEPLGRRVHSAARVVLTFNRLFKETAFVRVLGRMLAALEEVYEHPVDTEFTATLTATGQIEVNVLQCRPMWLPGARAHVQLPADVPDQDVCFRSTRFINGGVADPIRYVVYVDPAAYAALADDQMRKTLPRVIGQINQSMRLRGERVMMMGPGRWGSSNPDLGIGVGYADIDQVSVLVEIAHEEDGHVPEVSYGTHFFQDLVEAEIIYMPIYPEQPDAAYNTRFFTEAENYLAQIEAGLQAYESIVKVLDIPAMANQRHIRVMADPDTRQALCFIA